MKQTAFVLIICQGLLCACSQQTTEQPPRRQDPYPGVPAYVPKSLEPLAPNVETARRLSLPVRFNEGRLTLEQFAELIKKQQDVDCWFDWPALYRVGVTRQTAVPFKVGHIDADRALAAMLWYCSPNNNAVYPTYMIVDGLVVVGTNQSLVQKLPQVNWPKREDPEHAEHVDLGVRIKLNDQLTHQGSYGLDQIIAYIAESTGLKIRANWQALELVGIEQDSFVTIYYPYYTAGELLESVVEQVSRRQFDDDKAGFVIYKGEVRISTIRDLSSSALRTKTYHIDDLLMSPYGPALAGIYADDPFALDLLAEHNLAWQVRWLNREHRFGGREVLSREDVQGLPRYDREYAVDELRMMIEARSMNDDAINRWLDEDWTITHLDGTLTVRTMDAVHDDIEQLLGQLRETRRLTLLRFMRELEATRLIKQAEAAKRSGDREEAKAHLLRANQIDPGNAIVDAMLEVMRLSSDEASEPTPR